MIPAVENIRRMANIPIFNILVRKFSHEQELYPVFPCSINENTQKSLYYAVISLGLAVYLWIKYNKKLLFNIRNIIKQKSEL